MAAIARDDTVVSSTSLPIRCSSFLIAHIDAKAAVRAKFQHWRFHAYILQQPDGRIVFALPYGARNLIGTTDMPYEAPPETARATDTELDYLLASVNAILPEARL